MDDQEYESIYNYLKFKYIPSDLPIGSKIRRNWAQSVRKKYEIIRETKETAVLEYIGIRYKRGLDALGNRRPVVLRVPKKMEWQRNMQDFHVERGHPGRDGTMGLLTQHYYFPRMRESVVEYISNCMCDGKRKI
jgi:hypothetical protein